MKYLLDTCVVSDFVKGHKQTLQILKAINPASIGISAITQMEIIYGLKKNPKQAEKIEGIMHDFMDSISVLPFEQKVATSAGEIRAILAGQGTPIGAYDLLIGATALKSNRILVTSNTKEFVRIKGVTLENWRD